MRSRWVGLICGLGLLLASVTGQAQDAGAEQSPGQGEPPAEAKTPISEPVTPTQAVAVQRAREAYAEGQAKFQLRDFRGAEAAFLAAFSYQPSPVVLLSVAEAQQRTGRWKETAETLRRYLKLRPDAPDREAISRRVAALEQAPGKLRVVTEPAGAEVMLNGVSTGKESPVELSLPPGVHQLAFLLQGRDPAIESVVVESGAEREVKVALPLLPPQLADGSSEAAASGAAEQAVIPAPAAEVEVPVAGVAVTAAEETPVAALEAPSVDSSSADAPAVIEEGVAMGAVEGPTPAEQAQARSDRVTFWASVSVGAAGLVAGGVLGGMAMLEKQRFDDAPSEAIADRGERLAMFADFGFGVAIASAVTALVIATGPGRTGSFWATIGPSVGAQGAGLAARVRF